VWEAKGVGNMDTGVVTELYTKTHCLSHSHKRTRAHAHTHMHIHMFDITTGPIDEEGLCCVIQEITSSSYTHKHAHRQTDTRTNAHAHTHTYILYH